MIIFSCMNTVIIMLMLVDVIGSQNHYNTRSVSFTSLYNTRSVSIGIRPLVFVTRIFPMWTHVVRCRRFVVEWLLETIVTFVIKLLSKKSFDDVKIVYDQQIKRSSVSIPSRVGVDMKSAPPQCSKTLCVQQTVPQFSNGNSWHIPARIVCVDGNIGCGKSVYSSKLAQETANYGNTTYFPEWVPSVLLTHLYKPTSHQEVKTDSTTPTVQDMKTDSILFAIQLLTLQQIQLQYELSRDQRYSGAWITMDRSLYGNLAFACRHVMSGDLSMDQFRIYAKQTGWRKWTDCFADSLSHVLLYAPPKRCADAARARDPLHAGIPVEYLQTVHDMHMNLMVLSWINNGTTTISTGTSRNQSTRWKVMDWTQFDAVHHQTTRPALYKSMGVSSGFPLDMLSWGHCITWENRTSILSQHADWESDEIREMNVHTSMSLDEFARLRPHHSAETMVIHVSAQDVIRCMYMASWIATPQYQSKSSLLTFQEWVWEKIIQCTQYNTRNWIWIWPSRISGALLLCDHLQNVLESSFGKSS